MKLFTLGHNEEAQLKHEKGFSLVEMMVTVAVAAIVALLSSPVLMSMIKQQKHFEKKAESKSYVALLEKVVQKATILVRPELFNPAISFSYLPDNVSVTDPIALGPNLVRPFVETVDVDLTPPEAAPGWLTSSGLIASTTSSIELDSFTLGLMNVEVDSTGPTPVIVGEASRIFASRCVTNSAGTLGPGMTVTSGASPITSFRRIMAETRRPYVVYQGGRLRFRCCPPTDLTCSDGWPQFVPKIFMFFIENGIPYSVAEYPNAMESMGSFFFLTFNTPVAPDFYRMNVFNIENLCETNIAQRGQCDETNPALYLEPGQLLNSGVSTAVLREKVVVNNSVRFGKVSKDLNSSGVIILGESGD